MESALTPFLMGVIVGLTIGAMVSLRRDNQLSPPVVMMAPPPPPATLEGQGCGSTIARFVFLLFLLVLIWLMLSS